MRVVRYSVADKEVWDAFVGRSKNATFLLKRDYMDYHADRFPDHSLMLYDDSGELVTLLPATVGGGRAVISYGTYLRGIRDDRHHIGCRPAPVV